MSDPSTTSENDVTEPDGSTWNERIIAEFRANAGYVSWSSEAEFAAGRPVPPWMPGFDERGMRLILVHNIAGQERAQADQPVVLPAGRQRLGRLRNPRRQSA